MPRKDWTTEERAAFGAKMKAARERNKEVEPQAPAPQEPVPSPDNGTVNLSADQLNTLLDRIQKLEQSTPPPVNQQLTAPQEVNIGQMGQTLGVITKYPIDPNYYPDPTEGLYDLPEIQQFAPRYNYLFEWRVAGQTYETKFGTNIREPFFYLRISMLAKDAEGKTKYVVVDGERRLELYKLKDLIMNEDEQETIRIATHMGVEMNTDKRKLMDLIRFERLARMVKDVFFPIVPDAVQNAHSEIIVDGRPVQVVASATAV